MKQFALIKFLVILASLSVFSPRHSSAQVTVGYTTNISVTGSSISEDIYRQRVIDQYAISGVNVEPIDGSNNFNRETIWKINDESDDWSLSVVDSNPRIDVNSDEVSTRLVQAGRAESVSSNISGPLRSVSQRKTLSPFSSVQLPLIIPVSTSVFPEDLGIDKNTNRFQKTSPAISIPK